MKNFLIKFLGGVTAVEFAEVFSLASKDREMMVDQIAFYQSQCQIKDARNNYLEDLIFKKTGFIVDSDAIMSSEVKNFQPITGHQSWQSVRSNLERTHKIKRIKENAN